MNLNTNGEVLFKVLFQMCYGPEIEQIYNVIAQRPGITLMDLKTKFQYREEGDISSLIESVLVFLSELNMIDSEEGQYRASEREWSTIELLKRFQQLAKEEQKDSLNYVFCTIYEQLFVKPNKLFITNMHYPLNRDYERTLIGHEKINAWKRMMECFGLGRRVYSGFYALPHLPLLKNLVEYLGPWEGPLHQYCEEKINPILPCVTSEGHIFNGVLYGLFYLGEKKQIKIDHKQDLPYKSYGQKHEWNWIAV